MLRFGVINFKNAKLFDVLKKRKHFYRKDYLRILSGVSGWIKRATSNFPHFSINLTIASKSPHLTQVEYVNPSFDVKASTHIALREANVAPGCVSRRGDNV